MTCARCSGVLREGARYCPACGARFGTPSTGHADGQVAALQRALAPFAGLGVLREGPSSVPSTVIVGEAGRGRSTVARLLMEANVSEETTILDLVALQPGAVLESEIVPAVLAADVVLAVLSASQLLSASERALILHRILPICVGEVACVVTHIDALETEDDRSDLDRRLARFVESGGRDMPIFYVGRGASTGEALSTYVSEAAGRARRDATHLWARRILAALAPVEPSVAFDAGSAEAAVAAEADLALAETRALCRERIANLRATLPDRLAAMPPDRMRVEASAVLTGALQALGQELARSYLVALERALAAHPDGAYGTSAAGLTEGVTADAERRLHGTERAPRVAGARPRSLGAMALGGAGVVALVAIGGPVGIASGAAILYGAWATRKDEQRRFDQKSAEQTTLAVRGWLDENERLLDERLGALSSDVAGRLLARLAQMAPSHTGTEAELTEARRLAAALA